MKQDDQLYGVLTVKEALEYAALLQLPQNMSKEEKLQRVDEVMDEVGLSSVKDVKIGNVFYKGISGGRYNFFLYFSLSFFWGFHSFFFFFFGFSLFFFSIF